MAVHEMGMGDAMMFTHDQDDSPSPLAQLPPFLWVAVCSFLSDTNRVSLGLTCRRMAYLLHTFVGLEHADSSPWYRGDGLGKALKTKQFLLKQIDHFLFRDRQVRSNE
jgi:hypothetical protein